MSYNSKAKSTFKMFGPASMPGEEFNFLMKFVTMVTDMTLSLHVEFWRLSNLILASRSAFVIAPLLQTDYENFVLKYSFSFDMLMSSHEDLTVLF